MNEHPMTPHDPEPERGPASWRARLVVALVAAVVGGLFVAYAMHEADTVMGGY